MLNKKEITAIAISTIILAFVISLMQSIETFAYSLITIFLVILINLAAKKITSFYLDSEIETKLWEIRRYGFKAHKYFKKPFPLGAFLPLVTTAFSLGYFKWMATLVFEVKPKIHRAAKKHGLYSFSEMTEYHVGLIASSGIIINLIFAIVGYLIGFSDFARLNIYYAFFNMIPVSDLDGNKIFFGSLILWSFLAVIVCVALAYAFLLV